MTGLGNVLPQKLSIFSILPSMWTKAIRESWLSHLNNIAYFSCLHQAFQMALFEFITTGEHCRTREIF
jgi:hypothetical protein